MLILPSPFGQIGFFILGALWGSFLNVCIVRIPHEQSVVFPASHCPHCQRGLSWYENIPLFSYLFLRGQCRTCHQKISSRYFWVELLTAGLGLLTYYYLTPWPLALLYFLLLVCPLVVLSFIDLEHQILPNVITLPGVLVGLGVRQAHLYILHITEGPLLNLNKLMLQALVDSCMGVLVGAGTLFLLSVFYQKIRKREGLGFGDVKLAAMLGAFFGWKPVFVIFLVASITGSIVGLIYILFSKKDLKAAIPFGPFLALGALFHLYWGQAFLQAYLKFFKNLIH